MPDTASTTPTTGRTRRLRGRPGLFGVTALAVPVVTGIGVLAALPATAGEHRAPAVTGTATVPAAFTRSGSAADGNRRRAAVEQRKAATAAQRSKGTGDEHGQHTSSSPRAGQERAGQERTGQERAGSHRRDRLPAATPEAALGAYFDAGYGYEDALALARLWHRKGSDLIDVKVLAGRKLLAGRTLPVRPSNPPVSDSDLAIRAFLDAGYDYADAELLSILYGFGDDTYKAKVTAGSKLLVGGEVPIEHGQTAWEVSDDAARAAYFNNGYGYDDALVLAELWTGLGDLSDVKANAGHKLLDRLPLPLEDHGTEPPTADQNAVDAFFAAGYDYDDAVALAELWGSSDPYQAKVVAGGKLLAGISLPIKP